MTRYNYNPHNWSKSPTMHIHRVGFLTVWLIEHKPTLFTGNKDYCTYVLKFGWFNYFTTERKRKRLSKYHQERVFFMSRFVYHRKLSTFIIFLTKYQWQLVCWNFISSYLQLTVEHRPILTGLAFQTFVTDCISAKGL